MRTHLLAAAVLLALIAPPSVRAQGIGIELGVIAPNAVVETLDGERVELRSHFGRQPVVVEFWATWCPLCRQLETPMEAARTKFAGRVTFVSIGVRDNQTPERQKAYVEARRLGGVFLFDREGRAVAAYQVPHTSYLVVISAEGKVVYTGVGGDQDVEAAIAKAFVMDAASGR